MFTSNNKWMLLCITAIVVSIVGAVTYLAGQKIITGDSVTSLFILILGAVGVTGAVHVTGNVVQQTNGHETTVTTSTPTTVKSTAPVVITAPENEVAS